MKTRTSRFFACDFETTVYESQLNTEVWAAACVELFDENVKIFHSIEEQFNYFKSLKCNVVAYYHNLKFDGAFWLSYLAVDLKYQNAAFKPSDGTDDFSPDDKANDFQWYKPWEMKSKTFMYTISDMGQWYKILVKLPNNYTLEIRDSLKLLPFSVKKIGESFNTKHQKLDMEYTGFRFAGCEITKDEQHYISNDVLVIKEALEIMFTQNHTKLTIGSCCLEEFRKTLTNEEYSKYFPDLYQYKFNEHEQNVYGALTIGDYIRKAYRGGWCYLVKGKENKVFHNGTTADVNSLYPSMMHSESGNVYPVGLPTFWIGNRIPAEALSDFSYYFVRIKTRFYLKPGKLPFIQNKSSLMYRANESLETSDIYDPRDKKYHPSFKDLDGNIKPATMTMTLTCTDFELIKEHYELVDLEILDGCYFATAIGIFDTYINKYKKLKIESKGALRELAKLFLNNLYGKLAASKDSNFKVAFVKDDGTIGFYTVVAHDKQPGYIPCGAAITSYARNFTIRAAQKNYHGANKPGFIYADTDSIHCDLPPDKIQGIKVDDTNFCCWKLESNWDTAIFVRQKTYAEHVTHENLKPADDPFWSLKCAGMPQKSKQLMLLSMGENNTGLKELSFDDLKFAVKDRTIEDFKTGLVVPGKLAPKRIPGGIVLVDSFYELRPEVVHTGCFVKKMFKTASGTVLSCKNCTYKDQCEEYNP